MADNKEEKFNLTRLKLHEVSFVDQGANPGAYIALFKRDATNLWDKIKDVVTKDGGLTFDEIDGAQKAQDEFWRAFNIFSESVMSILHDDDVTDKQIVVRESLNQFNSALQDAVGNIVTKNGGDNAMTLDELKKRQDELEAKLKKAEEDSGDLQVSKEELEEENAKLKAQLEEQQAKMEEMAEKMEDEEAEKAEEDKEEEMMKSLSPSIRKRFEALEKRNEALEKDIAKRAEEAEIAKFEKRAESFKEMPVEKSELGVLLRAVAGNETAKAALEKCLNAGKEAMNTMTKSLGSAHQSVTSDAETAFYAQVDKVQKEDGIQKAIAVAKVRKTRPELWKAMQDAKH